MKSDRLLMIVVFGIFFTNIGALVIFYVYDDTNGMIFHGVIALILWISITKLSDIIG